MHAGNVCFACMNLSIFHAFRACIFAISLDYVFKRTILGTILRCMLAMFALHAGIYAILCAFHGCIFAIL